MQTTSADNGTHATPNGPRGRASFDDAFADVGTLQEDSHDPGCRKAHCAAHATGDYPTGALFNESPEPDCAGLTPSVRSRISSNAEELRTSSSRNQQNPRAKFWSLDLENSRMSRAMPEVLWSNSLERDEARNSIKSLIVPLRLNH